ncbi:MAG: 2-oxoacid:acceptor oxidoreductase family protein [Oscillospiraceae bacterium]|jgi:2-oxoglutarate ferredoxin oxidoreductase subunit gamma
MASYNMIFAGFGGQGVLFTGKVVAYAGLIDGKEVSWLPSYGPEMRGGTANCSVCISDMPVGSPLVTEPDVLIAMNSPSYDKFIDSVKPGGVVIIDSSLVTPSKRREDVKLYEVPATALSNEEHLEGIANMILLGKLLESTGFASMETVEQSLEKCVPPSKTHLLKHNLRAIRLGMEQ